MSTADAPPSTEAGAQTLSIWTIAYFVLAYLLAWLVLDHAPWRDEAQSMLIARDSPGLGDLLANMRNEGHPILWPALLWAALHVLPTDNPLSWVQFAIGLGNLTLIWFHAPFERAQRLLVAATYFVLFEYGVIARSYGLGLLLLLLFLTYRRSAAAWVFLALMSAVSLHFMMLSAFCVAALWLEGRRAWTGLLVWAIGTGLAVLTMMPAADTIAAAPMPQGFLRHVVRAILSSSTALIPVGIGDIAAIWDGRPAPHLAFLAAVLVPVLGWFSLRSSPLRPLFLAMYLAVMAVAIFIYPGFARHFGILYLTVLAFCWIRAEDGIKPPPAFLAWTGILAVIGLWMSVTAVFIPFAASAIIAQWARDLRIDQAAWATQPAWFGSELALHFGQPVLNLERGCLENFQRWNYSTQDHALMSTEQVVAALDRGARAAGGVLYLMTDRDVPESATIRLLQVFPRGLSDAGPLAVYRIAVPDGTGQNTLVRCP